MLNFGFLPVAKCAICNIFPNIFVHTFQVILPLYYTVGVGVSLMS